MRNQGAPKAPAAHSEHRKAHAVNGNRALLDQVTRLARGDLEGKQARLALRLDRDDTAYAVYVSGDKVAAQRFGKRQAAFEVHPVAGRKLSKGRAPQRLRGNLHLKPPASARYHREASSVDGN